MEKALLAAQVATMTHNHTQKNKEIRKCQAGHVVVLSKVRELVGHPGEIVNKTYLYNQLWSQRIHLPPDRLSKFW